MRDTKLATQYFGLAYMIGTVVGFTTFYIHPTVMWFSMFTIMPVVFGYFFYLYLKKSHCEDAAIIRETNMLICRIILTRYRK